MPTASSSTSKPKSKTIREKPYDRTLSSSYTSVKASTETGAPATHGQKTRKGKKAWRKNIDLRDEEEALEIAREEERVTGGRYSEKKDIDLFEIDTVGDVEVSKKMRRAPKQLRSLAVLDERSAIPSLTAKSITPSKNQTRPISKAEKVRLRRIARKELPDPDGTQVGVSDVKIDLSIPQSDAWVSVPDAIKKGTFGEETMVKKTVKAPKTLAEQRKMRAGRLVNVHQDLELPDDGTSYNPRAESHAALIEQAIQEELALLKREHDTEERLKELAEVVNSRKAVGRTGEFADGMLVGDGISEGDDESGSELDPADIPLPKKQTVRKTQAQRNKALKKRAAAEAEERIQKQKAIHKQLGASAVYEIKKQAEARLEEMREKEALAKVIRKEKERLGHEGGEKIGKWKVGKGRVEVQLGEDLAESLRQLKPEGNLFKDRFIALQKKALVEPRVPQLPTRRARKTKEYEKHAWKNFVV